MKLYSTGIAGIALPHHIAARWATWPETCIKYSKPTGIPDSGAEVLNTAYERLAMVECSSAQWLTRQNEERQIHIYL